MKPIVHTPDDVLTKPAKPVTRFDKKLADIVDQMKQTLVSTRNPKGVGLAAPQIGIPLRIFITRPDAKTQVRVFINPEIISRSQILHEIKKDDNRLEGCLSIPHVWGYVDRSDKVTLKYQDIMGKTYEEEITGFLATIVQHETDHVNGILFTHRVLEQQNKMYHDKRDKDGKEILEEIRL